jgi:hypothetical protein
MSDVPQVIEKMCSLNELEEKMTTAQVDDL